MAIYIQPLFKTNESSAELDSKFVIDFCFTDSIENIKIKIREKLWDKVAYLPLDVLTLIFSGRILDSSRTVDDYNIQKDHVLYLKIEKSENKPATEVEIRSNTENPENKPIVQVEAKNNTQVKKVKQAKPRIPAKQVKKYVPKVGFSDEETAIINRIQSLKSKYWEAQNEFNNIFKNRPIYDPEPPVGPNCKYKNSDEFFHSEDGKKNRESRYQRNVEFNARIKTLSENFEKCRDEYFRVWSELDISRRFPHLYR